ncbi:hypothetical protein [Antribacter gilvus]|uniref:hypothetical protein n=1 Tax=Antribacter gilvus TaxID=2304675 RepID=UPI0013DF851A|nr:hypothetical protein [Antribacter gilvus]
MGKPKPTPYDPRNVFSRALAEEIEAKRESLSAEDKKKLADELNGGQNLGIIDKILRGK